MALRPGFHLGAALGAGDADAALALGDGENLSASGALEELRGLALAPHLLGGPLGSLDIRLCGGGAAAGAGAIGARFVAAELLDKRAQAGDLGDGVLEQLVLVLAGGEVLRERSDEREDDNRDGDP